MQLRPTDVIFSTTETVLGNTVEIYALARSGTGETIARLDRRFPVYSGIELQGLTRTEAIDFNSGFRAAIKGSPLPAEASSSFANGYRRGLDALGNDRAA